jgi:hypothetical protein
MMDIEQTGNIEVDRWQFSPTYIRVVSTPLPPSVGRNPALSAGMSVILIPRDKYC